MTVLKTIFTYQMILQHSIVIDNSIIMLLKDNINENIIEKVLEKN